MDVQPIEDTYDALGIIPACEGFSRAGDALVDRWRSARARLASEHAMHVQRIADRARALAIHPVLDRGHVVDCQCDLCR